VHRTGRRRSVCDGLYVIRGRRRSTPLVIITPFWAAVGHRRTEPGGYFCWKLILTRTPDPIRPTRRGPDPNWLTNGRKENGLWPRGVCPGNFGRTPPETIGDSRTECNRVLCSSKCEAAVTSNKKTALQVCWSWLLTNTKHPVASLRQLSFLFCMLYLLILINWAICYDMKHLCGSCASWHYMSWYIRCVTWYQQ